MRATIATPRTPGAIAIVQIDGDIDAAIGTLGIAPIGVGERRLCDLCGVDRGVVVRWSDSCLQLMPHGGKAVVDALVSALGAAGVEVGDGPIGWPEARCHVESLALDAIASAASPMAIPLLLAQPARWAGWDGVSPTADEIEAHSRILGRLLVAPIIVAAGRPNVGKSALCNALCGRDAALVADAPGVTRDHVGVVIRLGAGAEAMTVRWIDTPGIPLGAPVDAIDEAAQCAALSMIGDADLVALCGDASSGFVDPSSLPIREGCPVIRVGVRSDLGSAPGADIETSALTGEGLAGLAGLLRSTLFPKSALRWDGPWRFAEGLPAGPGADS